MEGAEAVDAVAARQDGVVSAARQKVRGKGVWALGLGGQCGDLSVTGDMSDCSRTPGDGGGFAGCANILLPVRLFALDFEEEGEDTGAGDGAWREGLS